MSRSWLRPSLLAVTVFLACKPQGERAEAVDAGNALCPARVKVGATLPNTPAALSKLESWRSHELFTQEQLDEVLLSAAEIAAHDAALRSADASSLFVDLARPLDTETLRRELYQRLSLWEERFRTNEHTLEKGDGLALIKSAAGLPFAEERSLYVALAPIPLRCAPTLDVVRSVRGDKRFDRNLCSQVRAQEPVEVLGRLGKMRFVRSAYAIGFIADDAPLSARVPAELEPHYRRPRERVLETDLDLSGVVLKAGSVLVSASDTTVHVAGAKGFEVSRSLRDEEARPTTRPLTRGAFLREAFRFIDTPYGLGDERGGRDCSRLVLDVLRHFGLHLPRASVQQSQSGLYTIEVPSDASETERLGLLDETAERGVVLMHFPGHIAFYLGRDQSGVPRLLHSFAEFLRSCPAGGETLVEVDRVAVSDLSLGKHTSRRSFLERMTRLTVFWKPPGQGLLAVSRFRGAVAPSAPPAECQDQPEEPTQESPRRGRRGVERARGASEAPAHTALFVLPREPLETRPLRVVASSDHELRPASLWLFDPSGQRHDPVVHDLGVGPYARWGEIAQPGPGTWKAVVADGARVLACRSFKVHAARKESVPTPRAVDAPAWRERHAPTRTYENLYAAFVEQLFAHPLDDMRSWSSLSELLHNPERNLLYDYLGMAEDAQVSLSPDCADLPYSLRAYFSWKLGLPFGFRHCSRGRADAPPRCGEPVLQSTPVEAPDDVTAFKTFMRQVSSGVHSASGRTLPQDESTDLYPLPLTREALRPGSVFVDPYGHLIVVAQWVPQGFAGQGMLMGADAQPDASVGRRRFWRGNFLFSPDTSSVGAGFKGFRPLPGKQVGEQPPPPLAWALSPPDTTQYEGSADDFYARMDALIYPRPIASSARMSQLVSALEEQVKRRVEAIDLGEAYLRDHGGVMTMPQGFSIFETAGAWEDFATPSRDMRLLIAIDAVRDFPAQVKRTPERFLASQAEVDAAPAALDALLAARTFTYTGSDGSAQTLSLKQLLSRNEALELGYNPNDCVEWRWGAREGTDELARCKRRAPVAQQREMERYREWFHTRTRPARP